jgi:hypothetical protein
MTTWEEIEAEKRRLKAEYGTLFEAMAEILFRHDPIGINFGDNTDEYEPEARTILPRLRACRSSDDVLAVVHEEFRRWFGDDTAGPREGYNAVAEEIWRRWQRWRAEANDLRPRQDT